jgi:hypothetical protein
VRSLKHPLRTQRILQLGLVVTVRVPVLYSAWSSPSAPQQNASTFGRTITTIAPLMRLNQVTVAATDVAASVRFYIGLGLKLIVSTPHYARFECPDGDSTFSVHLVEHLLVGSPTVVYFECACKSL